MPPKLVLMILTAVTYLTGILDPKRSYRQHRLVLQCLERQLEAATPVIGLFSNA